MTKLVSFEDAIQLVMVLPGETAKETRAQFADIIRRYMAGDNSLHAEIEANSVSSSPIALMARASLPGQQEEDEWTVGIKRRREQLELLRLEHEINTVMIDNKVKQQELIFATAAELERIRDPSRSNLDDRTRLMIQDALQNSLLHDAAPGQQLALTNGASALSPHKPISIASVAKDLGFRPTTDDAKRIGMDLRKLYISQHGKPPPKHDQLCDGRITAVNSYTEQDRPLVVQALHAFFRNHSDSE